MKEEFSPVAHHLGKRNLKWNEMMRTVYTQLQHIPVQNQYADSTLYRPI